MRLFILLFCLLAVLSCTDIPDSDLQLQPTEMKVRVIDDTYTEVAGARVYIYRDYISFQTKTGEVAIDTTEADGYAHFTNLEPYNYFIYAVHNKGTGVYDNSLHYNALYDYLTENAVTTVSVKTDFLRDGDPTQVTINYFAVTPRDLNKYWDGKEFDTLQGEFMIIRNYDEFGLISDQDILARTTFLMAGKIKYGITQTIYPVDLSYDPVTIDLDNLQNSGDTYTLLISCFINQADFDNKDQIYAGLAYKTDYVPDEYFNFSDGILASMTQDNPYPQMNYVDYTFYQKANYLIFTNLTWE